MPTLQPPDNAFDRLQRALTPADAVNDPFGLHKINISGTVNLGGGGGAGGTSTTDDSSFVPGSSSLTPAGGYYGGRSVASGHVAAPAMSGSAILQVDVVAGGVGGGAAQNQMRGTAGNWVDVGIASGAAGAAGNWALPVVYASGVYTTVNIGNAHGVFGSVSMVGSVGVTPLASFTVNLGSIPTVNLGLGTVNIGNVPAVVGSVNVSAVGTFSVWVANAAAGGGFATVGVFGSVNVIGSVNVTPVASFTVNLASHIDTAGSAVRVNVVAGGAGGGVANIQVRGTAGTNVYVGVASGAPGTDGAYALPILYASGVYQTVNLGAGVLGSVNVLNLGGSVGALGIGGSMGVTQIGAPWSVTGSMGVTPLASFTVNPGSVFTVNLGLGTVNLGNGVVGSVNVTPVASFTVNLGSIPTVNLGLGTVNIGTVVTATLPAVSVVDTRGSLTATQWLINFGGSGYSAISVASLNPAVRTYLYSVMVVASATVDISFQSPSGTFLTGSLHILPGAGFAMQTQLANPMLIGGANAALFIHATGTQNIGGWVNGWVAP